MGTIDKSVCALCTFEKKCKRIKHCGSNELGINVKKQMIERAQDALYGLANDLGCDLLDIGNAKEYIRKVMEGEKTHPQPSLFMEGVGGEMISPNGTRKEGDRTSTNVEGTGRRGEWGG